MNVVRKAQAPVGEKIGSRKMRLYSAEERTMFSSPPSNPPETEFANRTRSLPVSRAQLTPSELLQVFDRTPPSVTPGTATREAGRPGGRVGGGGEVMCRAWGRCGAAGRAGGRRTPSGWG